LAIYERENGIKLEEEMKRFQLRFNPETSDVEVAIKKWTGQCLKMFPGINWYDEINWKYDYYIYAFTECNINFSNPSNRTRSITQIRHICKKYLESLFWCINYYHGNCLSWSWYYPYHEPPMWSDVAGAIKSLILEDNLCEKLDYMSGDKVPWHPIE